MKTEHGNGNGHGKSLAVEAQRLLPTPTAQDAASSNGANPDWGHGVTLTDAARATVTDFGPYTDAVRRWEPVIGRPAPPPTEVSARWVAARARRFSGRHPMPVGRRGSLRRFLRPERRLSPAFVEHMMGLPDGWVTGVPGVPRVAQLRILGNGIVPQQMTLALALLLDTGGSHD